MRLEPADVGAMRILSWNVARGRSRLAEQAAALALRGPDVVALQEISARTLPLWRQALAAVGLNHVSASLDSADPAREPATRRRTGVLLASRNHLSDTSRILGLPWSENAISGTTDADSHRVEVVCVHVRTQPTGGSRSRRCKRSAPAWRARRRAPECSAAISTSRAGSLPVARCSHLPAILADA